jgi:hypothetical protein
MWQTLFLFHFAEAQVQSRLRKGPDMKTRLSVMAIFVLAFAAAAMAADDPFNGTWRALPSKTGDIPQTGLLKLTPSPDGIIIQESGGEPVIVKYCKDIANSGLAMNITRIDDHNLATTYSLSGKIVAKEIGTVSADGKHYVRNQETVEGASRKSVEEFDRVGGAPAGDAFFGTWQRMLPKPKETGPLTYTIKIDADSFDFAGSGSSSYKGKLDGKEYKRPEDDSTMRAKRFDTQTIELSFKTTAGIPATMLWQVKGNTLTRTTKMGDARGQGRVVEFERVK